MAYYLDLFSPEIYDAYSGRIDQLVLSYSIVAAKGYWGCRVSSANKICQKHQPKKHTKGIALELQKGYNPFLTNIHHRLLALLVISPTSQKCIKGTS